MSYLMRCRHVAQVARNTRPLSVSIVRLSGDSVPPNGRQTGAKESSSITGRDSQSPLEAPQSGASSSSAASSNSRSSSEPLPESSVPPSADYSFWKRYRVMFIGTMAVFGAFLAIPQLYVFRSMVDTYQERDQQRKALANARPITAATEEDAFQALNVAAKSNSDDSKSSSRLNSGASAESEATQPSTPQEDEIDGAAPPAATAAAAEVDAMGQTVESGGDSKSTVGNVSSDSVDSTASDVHVAAVSANVSASGAVAKSVECEDSGISDSSLVETAEEMAKEQRLLDEAHQAKLEELAAERKQRLEEARMQASQNAEECLRKLTEVADIARLLYVTVTSDTKGLMMETFRSIEGQVMQNPGSVKEAKAASSQLRQSIGACKSEMEDVGGMLQAYVAALDIATATVQGQGDVEQAHAASQQASEVLKSLHTEAEQAAQAQADLAVMQEYERQVEQRVQHHQQRMAQLEAAQLDALEKLAGRSSAEDDSSSSIAEVSQPSVYDQDVQALLSYAQQRVNVMERNLSSGQERQARDVTALLEQQRAEDARVMQLKLDHLKQQLHREHAEEMQEKDVEAYYKLEKDLRVQMKRQAAAHIEHLQAALQAQSQQLADEWHTQLEVELRRQAGQHSQEVDTLEHQIREARKLLFTAAKSVESGSVSHKLWQVCSSLTDSLAHTMECPPLRPIVDQIRAEAGGDALLAAAVDAIPTTALEHGLQTERVLRQRFPTVRRGCERVAMVPENGEHGFWTYAMSYVRSLVAFPRHDLSLDRVDLSSLETCDLLALVERKLNDGDMEQAVRILNQLRGQSRIIAQDWLDQARLLLETRQAFDVILSQLLLSSDLAADVAQ